ncbi:uncharacterized protein TNCV_2923761 [Trichonephila clavipes]|nr:uncharacterized protein TNCV_2923761 [Trichonephila clavipes]
MATSTNKTAAFGVKLIHKCMSKHRYIQKKLTVWCALWAGGIIRPYFFKNDEGHNVTVNGDRYRAMVTNFFIPELNSHDIQELWFQQDGATCHTARATIELLKDTLDDHLISRFGPVNWSSRSSDLTPLDYFMWDCVKSLVYADTPQTLDHLEDNIRRVIADIRPQMLEKVIENWTSRLYYIRVNRGSHMPEIIFKIKIISPPFFLEILIFELALELFEHCSLIQSFDGVLPDSTLVVQPVISVDERIPIVHSLTVWKICEAFDLKAEFIPLPGTTVLLRTPHRGVDQTTTAPVVGFARRWIFQPLTTHKSSEQLVFESRTNRYQWCSQLLFLNLQT